MSTGPVRSDHRPVYVLDTFAVIAYLRDEPGAERVRQLFDSAAARICELAMSVVNIAEVFYISRRDSGPRTAYEIVEGLRTVPLEIVDADLQLSLRAGELKAQYPVSLADCYAAALASLRDGIVVTGDPEFEKLEPEVQVEWLPR